MLFTVLSVTQDIYAKTISRPHFPVKKKDAWQPSGYQMENYTHNAPSNNDLLHKEALPLRSEYPMHLMDNTSNGT